MNITRGLLLVIFGCNSAAWGQETHHHHDTTAPAQPTSEAQGESAAHVPPAPPEHVMPEMTAERMTAVMEMNDAARFGKFTLNEAEWTDDDVFAWDLDAWYGSDADKLWIKSAGAQHGSADHFSVETLWDHVFARWWSVRGGIRYDEIAQDARSSLVLGLHGLAPQWFDVEADLYLDEHGVISVHTEVDYDLLLTQRLILQPSAELTAYGADVAARGIGSGLAEVEFSLRLRYEWRREFAPYIGISWAQRFGNTADFARSIGRDVHDTAAFAGIRCWF